MKMVRKRFILKIAGISAQRYAAKQFDTALSNQVKIIAL
jgi:hypothetical protein